MPVDTSRTDKLISNSPITTAQNANLQISGRMKIPRFVTSHFLTCEGACEWLKSIESDQQHIAYSE